MGICAKEVDDKIDDWSKEHGWDEWSDIDEIEKKKKVRFRASYKENWTGYRRAKNLNPRFPHLPHPL